MLDEESYHIDEYATAYYSYSIGKMQGGFQALVKRFGKWYRLATPALSKQQATRLGASYSESTLGKSFRVAPFGTTGPSLQVPKGMHMPNMERFYYSGKQKAFTERKQFGLNLPSELKEIFESKQMKKLLGRF